MRAVLVAVVVTAGVTTARPAWAPPATPAPLPVVRGDRVIIPPLRRPVIDGLRLEGSARIELPFGDVDTYRAAIDRFYAVEAKLNTIRTRFASQAVATLAALGEGPGKDKKAPWSRICPAAKVARPYLITRRALDEYVVAGVDLEEAFGTVDTLDDLGETAALTPDYRAKVAYIRKAWRSALVDLREMRAMMTAQLGRELAARRCTPALLAMMSEQRREPSYGAPAVENTPTTTKRTATPAAPATFFIDNRDCPDTVGIWVDGEPVGEVPSGARSALDARVGRRTVCIIPTTSTATAAIAARCAPRTCTRAGRSCCTARGGRRRRPASARRRPRRRCRPRRPAMVAWPRPRRCRPRRPRRLRRQSRRHRSRSRRSSPR